MKFKIYVAIYIYNVHVKAWKDWLRNVTSVCDDSWMQKWRNAPECKTTAVYYKKM